MGQSTGESLQVSHQLKNMKTKATKCERVLCSCLQKAAYQRGMNLHDLRNVIEEISNQIMWVNDKEEEELVFDWADKNIDAYIPNKEESFSVRTHKHTQM